MDIQYQVVELQPAIAEVASQLVSRHPLRAYDAVQLASAVSIQSLVNTVPEANSLVFVTADSRLMAVAQAEELTVDDPNIYP
jgi:uncharacterized protein